MNYFWITQKPKSQQKELADGYIKSRPLDKYNYFRESVKNIRKGDVLFFCSRGIINHIGFADSSVIYESDEKGDIWRVKFNHFTLGRHIEILEHKKYLLDNKKIKYSPITNEGKSQQGYCSEIPDYVANFLLSRAGVYLSHGKVIELEKGSNNRIKNIHDLLGKLKRNDVIDVINNYKVLKKSLYNYQQSSTYDLKYSLNFFAPKVIFGFSAAKVLGRPLFSDEFSGGNETPCFEILKGLGFEIVEKSSYGSNIIEKEINEIDEDVSAIEQDQGLTITERQQLVDARIGQGKFRKDVISLHKKCIVTGIDLKVLLRASHIKPWKYSTNQERLDPANGLLLSSSIDVLFDRGLISFEDNGRIIISEQLQGSDVLEKLGVDIKRNFPISPKNCSYLRWHRKKYFS